MKPTKTYDFQVKIAGVWKSIMRDTDLDWLKEVAKRHFSRHKKQRFATICEKKQAP